MAALNLNSVTFAGHLGADPEVRYTGDGKPVTTITVASTNQWRDSAGEKKERTEWMRVVFFGPLADPVAKYLKKGMNVYVEGSLYTNSYTDDQGVVRYTTQIRGNRFDKLSSGTSSRDGRDDVPAQAPSAQQAAADDLNSDDIPF